MKPGLTPRAAVLAAVLAAAAALLAAWDASGLDLEVMRRIAGPDGFALRDAFVTRVALHDGGRIVAGLRTATRQLKGEDGDKAPAQAAHGLLPLRRRRARG